MSNFPYNILAAIFHTFVGGGVPDAPDGLWITSPCGWVKTPPYELT